MYYVPKEHRMSMNIFCEQRKATKDKSVTRNGQN